MKIVAHNAKSKGEYENRIFIRAKSQQLATQNVKRKMSRKAYVMLIIKYHAIVDDELTQALFFDKY